MRAREVNFRSGEEKPYFSHLDPEFKEMREAGVTLAFLTPSFIHHILTKCYQDAPHHLQGSVQNENGGTPCSNIIKNFNMATAEH